MDQKDRGPSSTDAPLQTIQLHQDYVESAEKARKTRSSSAFGSSDEDYEVPPAHGGVFLNCLDRLSCRQIHLARHIVPCTAHVFHDVCVCTSASCHPCRAFDLFSLFLALFLSVCLSYPVLFSFHFYLDPDLNLFLHVVDVKASTHWQSAK